MVRIELFFPLHTEFFFLILKEVEIFFQEHFNIKYMYECFASIKGLLEELQNPSLIQLWPS